MIKSSNLSPDDLNTYVEQTSRLMDFPIPEDSMAGVVDNLARMQALATLVMEFPLPEEVESAAIFQP